MHVREVVCFIINASIACWLSHGKGRAVLYIEIVQSPEAFGCAGVGAWVCVLTGIQLKFMLHYGLSLPT